MGLEYEIVIILCESDNRPKIQYKVECFLSASPSIIYFDVISSSKYDSIKIILIVIKYIFLEQSD